MADLLDLKPDLADFLSVMLPVVAGSRSAGLCPSLDCALATSWETYSLTESSIAT